MDTPVNGRDSDQFPLRLPDGVRDHLTEAAAANNRSMNAEILARIEQNRKTLRDEMAMAALPIMAGRLWKNTGLELVADWAATAYAVADAMLAEREKAGEK